MSQDMVEMKGTLQPDGTLLLDAIPNLPPGRVAVVMRPVVEEAPPQEDWWEFMQRSRRELEASGHKFMNDEEMEAHIEWLREGDWIDDMLQQLDKDHPRRE